MVLSIIAICFAVSAVVINILSIISITKIKEENKELKEELENHKKDIFVHICCGTSLYGYLGDCEKNK